MSEDQDWNTITAPPLVAPAKPKLKKPPMYKVIFLNDDYTPIDYVTSIITIFFGHSDERAYQLANDVHKKGKAVVGTYSKDIAETKIFMVMQDAQQMQYPLMLTIEEV